VRSEAHGVTDKLAPDHAFDPALRGGIRHGKKQPEAARVSIVFGVTQSVNLVGRRGDLFAATPSVQRLGSSPSNEAGSMRETDNDAVMERINKDGQVIGFSILGVGKLSKERD